MVTSSGLIAVFCIKGTTAIQCPQFCGRESISPEAERCSRSPRTSLMLGIEQVQPDGRLSDIGNAVQTHVEAAGFSVVREFVGHGIGTGAPRGPSGSQFRSAGAGSAAAAGLGTRHRTDGQRGQLSK